MARWESVRFHVLHLGQSFGDLLFDLGQLEPLASSEETPILEHVVALRMKGPEASLARPVGPTRNLYKTVIERKIVPQRVLPPLRVFPIERKPVHYELVDVTEGQHLIRRSLDGHCRQRNV